MADLFTTTREIARQAAREAVARDYEAMGWRDIAAEVRAGTEDRNKEVANYLAGADASHAAVLAAVVRAAADVAHDFVIVNRKAAMSRFFANGSPGKNRLLDEANGAASVRRAILALTPETAP